MGAAILITISCRVRIYPLDDRRCERRFLNQNEFELIRLQLLVACPAGFPEAVRLHGTPAGFPFLWQIKCLSLFYNLPSFIITGAVCGNQHWAVGVGRCSSKLIGCQCLSQPSHRFISFLRIVDVFGLLMHGTQNKCQSDHAHLLLLPLHVYASAQICCHSDFVVTMLA